MEHTSRKQRANKLMRMAENRQPENPGSESRLAMQELYSVHDQSRSANRAIVALEIKSQRFSQVSQASLLSSSANRQTIRAE
jgi:hypothetical protein